MFGAMKDAFRNKPIQDKIVQVVLFLSLMPFMIFAVLTKTIFKPESKTNRTQRVADNVYVIESGTFLFLRSTMTIFRLESGDLILHSVVDPTAACLKQVSAIGKPKYMIVPSLFHDRYCKPWKEKFPQLHVLAPKIITAELSKLLPVHGTCEDVLPSLGVKYQDPTRFLYTVAQELIYFFPMTSGGYAMTVSDLFMNIPWLDSMFSTLPFGWSGLRVARNFRINFIKDERGLKLFLLTEVFNTKQSSSESDSEPFDIRAVCFSHGIPLVGASAAGQAAQAISWSL